MCTAFPEGMIANFEDVIPLMRNHPKDRHVLAAAAKAGCDCILTEYLGDFPFDVLTPYGVAAISPDDFLVSLLERTLMGYGKLSTTSANRTGIHLERWDSFASNWANSSRISQPNSPLLTWHTSRVSDLMCGK